MNWKHLGLAAVAVLVSQAVVAGAIMQLVVGPLFDEPALLRPESEQKIIPYVASRILFVGIFVGAFALGLRQHGWRAGLRYGLLVWLFYSIPMTVGFWAFLRMPDGMAVAWIGTGLAEYLTGGLVLGLLCPSSSAARAECG